MPPGLAKIFFSDIQSVTLNYHTHRHILLGRVENLLEWLDDELLLNGLCTMFKLCIMTTRAPARLKML